MTVQAVDVPSQNAPPRFDTAEIIVNVIRNPNAPEFETPLYNKTISEYIGVRGSVLTVRATDRDPINTPSGTIRYSILNIAAFDNQAGQLQLPNEFDFFVVSPSTGIIYLAQPLTEYWLPQIQQPDIADYFRLSVLASDSAVPAKTATTQVELHIVRNIHRPLFTEVSYERTIERTWAVGRPLFTVTAIDEDINVPLNAQTPNAEFKYDIDSRNFPEADKFFAVTQDGIVYVRNSLLSSDAQSNYFFYILATDKSWNPLSSRLGITVNITEVSGTLSSLGFTQRIITWDLAENVAPDLTTPLTLQIANQDSPITCRIVAINSVDVTVSDIFGVRTTTDSRNCELYLLQSLDREVAGDYNITIEVNRVSNRKKRQITTVSNTWNRVYVLVSVEDVNDNAPVFEFPSYPSNTAPNSYVLAVSKAARPDTTVGRLMAVDPDSGTSGQVTYSMDSFSQSSPFYLNDDHEVVLKRGLGDLTDSLYLLQATATDSGDSPQFSNANVYVNVIEDSNRFVLRVPDLKTEQVVPLKEEIRQKLQEITGSIVIIETIQPSIELTGSRLDFNNEGSEITFVVANPGSARLFSNTALDLVTNNNNPNSVTKLSQLGTVVGLQGQAGLTIRQPYSPEAYSSASEAVLAALNLGQNVGTVHKSYTWWKDDPWAAFVALGGLVFGLALVAIIVLLRSYTKYHKFVKRFRVYQTTMASADFTEPPSFLREYETQSLNMYVPPDETVQELGEINMGFQGATPRAGGGAGTVMNPVYGKVPY